MTNMKEEIAFWGRHWFHESFYGMGCATCGNMFHDEVHYDSDGQDCSLCGRWTFDNYCDPCKEENARD